jgi:translation initiation factor IF-3
VIRKSYQKKRPNRTYIAANFRIKFPEVRVLTEHGEMVGVMPTKEAISRAYAAEKDLVLVTEKANPPIAKIIELSKFKYQLQQKIAKSRKKNRNQDLKEVRFSIFMGEADFQSRLKKVINFIEKGHKVRLTLNFKGRQIAKKDLAYDLFDKIFAATKDIAQIEIKAKIMGKKLMAQISPEKKK